MQICDSFTSRRSGRPSRRPARAAPAPTLLVPADTTRSPAARPDRTSTRPSRRWPELDGHALGRVRRRRGARRRCPAGRRRPPIPARGARPPGARSRAARWRTGPVAAGGSGWARVPFSRSWRFARVERGRDEVDLRRETVSSGKGATATVNGMPGRTHSTIGSGTRERELERGDRVDLYEVGARR